MGGSSRRLAKELAELRAGNSEQVRIVEVDEANMLRWKIQILPDREPYNKGAFEVSVNFPAEYPFKPPRITFNTKIYHPNVDEKGQVCLALVSAENWKPATRTEQVINALLVLIAEPELDHPLRAELAEEYNKDKKKFLKTAEDYTRQHAQKRTP